MQSRKIPKTRAQIAKEMEVKQRTFSDLKRLLLSYKNHLDYFHQRDLVVAERGTYNYRLTQLLQLVPELETKKYALDDLELTDVERLEVETRFNLFGDSYRDLIGGLQQWIEDAKTTVKKEGSHEDALKPRIKFPTIKLPEFDGSLDKWMHFRDSFESLVHRSNVLSVMEKYHYLRSSIKLTGGQSSVLEELPLGEAYYEKAWETVKERYDDGRKLKAQHFNTLFTIKKMTGETPQELRRLIDSFSSTITTLEQLHADWDDMLVHVVQFRLDDQTLKDWQKQLGEDDPSWEMLKQFMKSQWRTLDQLPQHKKAAPKSVEVKPSRVSSKALVTSESLPKSNVANNASSLSCLLCNESHMLYQCFKFIAMSPTDRMNLIKEKSLCRNCFSPLHHTKVCKSPRRCKKCNGTHNTLIHLERAGTTQSSSEVVVKADVHQPKQSQMSAFSEPFRPYSQPKGTSNVAMYAGQMRKETLLSTVKLHVLDATGSVQEVRALLDNGSDMNFVTTSRAIQLGLPMTDSHISLTGINERTTIVRHSTVATIISRYGNFEQEIKFSVMSKLTGNLPSRQIDMGQFMIPVGHTLADPDFNKPSKVDMLLGADVFYEALLQEKFRLVDGPMMGAWRCIQHSIAVVVVVIVFYANLLHGERRNRRKARKVHGT